MTPPTVTNTVPSANATGVALNSTVTIAFNEPLDASTVTSANVTVSPATATVTYEASSNAIVLALSGQGNNQGTTVTVSTAVKDVAGNALAQAFVLSFTTAQETIRPTVTSTTPANNALNVARSATVSVVFSEPMDTNTLTAANLTIGGVTSTVTYDATTRTATLSPSAQLPNAAQLTVTIKSAVTDLAGNTLAADHVFSFTTQDTVPPSVTMTTPANGATGVPNSSDVVIYFSEPIATSSLAATTALLDGRATFRSWNAANNSLTLTPQTSYGSLEAITGRVTTGVTDVAGNPLANEYVFSFTAANTDTTRPTVTAVSPASGANYVSRSSTIVVTFSEAMDPSTIVSSSFIVSGTSFTTSWDATTLRATLTPTAQLANATQISVYVTTAVKDLAGNALANTYLWNFRTEDSRDPFVVSHTPAEGATDVARNTLVQLTFNEQLQSSTVNSTNIFCDGHASTVLWSSSLNRATLAPFGGQWPAGAVMNCHVTTAIRDMTNTPPAAQFDLSFTTFDNVAPTVASTNPASNATGVPLTGTVKVTFSEAMDPASISSTNIYVSGQPASVTYDAATFTATLTPNTPFTPNTPYTAYVATTVRDTAGNYLSSTYSWSFTSEADTTAPTVTGVTPANGATNVARTTPYFEAVFNEPLTASTVNAGTFTCTRTIGASTTSQTGTVTYLNATRTARFTLPSYLSYLATYSCTLGTGITDLNGNALAAPYTFSFSTGADNEPPLVLSSNPAQYGHFHSVTQPLKVTFDEDVNASTVNATNITLAGLTGTVTYDAPTRTATFTPAAALTISKGYVLTVNNISDLAGHTMTSPHVIEFRTTHQVVKLNDVTRPAFHDPRVVEMSGGTLYVYAVQNGNDTRLLQWSYRTTAGVWTNGDLGQTNAFGYAILALTPFANRTKVMVMHNGSAIANIMTKVFDGTTWSSFSDFSSSANAKTMLAGSATHVVALTDVQGSGLWEQTFDGTAWKLSTKLGTTNDLAVGVASNGTTIIVAYRRGDATNTTVYTRLFDGTSWGAEQAATSIPAGGVATSMRGAIASNGTGYALAFADANNIATATYAAGTWTPWPTGLTAGPFNSLGLATDGTGYGLTFTGGSSVYGMVYAAGTWSAPTSFASGTNPKIASNGSGYVVAVQSGADLRAVSNSTGSWASTTVRTASTTPVLSSFVAAGSRYAMSWSEGTQTYGAIHDAGAWGAAERLDTSSAATAPLLATLGTTLFALTVDDSAPAARLSASGSTFGAPETVPYTGVNGQVATARIALAPNGKALAAWEQYDRGLRAVFARAFDGQSWGTTFRVAADGVDPYVATDGTRWVISYYAGFKGTNNYAKALLVPWTEAGGLGTVVQLAPGAPSFAPAPHVAYANGGFYVIWGDFNGMQGKYSADGLSWGATEVISTQGTLQFFGYGGGFAVTYSSPTPPTGGIGTYLKVRTPGATGVWDANPTQLLGICSLAPFASDFGGVCKSTNGNNAVYGVLGKLQTTIDTVTQQNVTSAGTSARLRIGYGTKVRDYLNGDWTPALTPAITVAAMGSDSLRTVAIGGSAGLDALIEDPAAGYTSVGVFDPNPLPAISPAMYSGEGEIAASWLVVHPTTFRHDVYGAVF